MELWVGAKELEHSREPVTKLRGTISPSNDYSRCHVVLHWYGQNFYTDTAFSGGRKK